MVPNSGERSYKGWNIERQGFWGPHWLYTYIYLYRYLYRYICVCDDLKITGNFKKLCYFIFEHTGSSLLRVIFSCCGEWGLAFIAVYGRLLLRCTGSRAHKFSSRGVPLVDPQHVESSRTRDWTHVPELASRFLSIELSVKSRTFLRLAQRNSIEP